MARITGSTVGISATLVDMNRGTYSKQFTKRLEDFERRVEAAAVKAAAEAQRVSVKKAAAIRPPSAPRPGRRQAPGALGKSIKWGVDAQDNTFVSLDVAAMDSNVPWWRVQEIGTGKSATMKMGGAPRGRPTKGQSRRVSIKSQKGRRLPGSLVFVNGANRPVAFQDRSLRQRLAKPKGYSRTHPIYIKNEIPGKHFIRDGAREGFRDYRNDLVAAAKATLSKRR